MAWHQEHHREKQASCGGFSMLEISIVLLIIALVTGMGMMATLGVLDTAKYTTTEKKMDTIERALAGFRGKNNRLPCPATLTLTASSTNYGVESQPIGDCTTATPAASALNGSAVYAVAEGGVPTKTLGLPDSYMYDAWGRKFVYAVDMNATIGEAFNAIHPREWCEIIVNDGQSINRTGNTANFNGALYMLLSHGPNGHGGYTETGTRMSAGSQDTDEHQNCHCDEDAALAVVHNIATYVQKEMTDTFDDMVRFKERWQMTNDDDNQRFSVKRSPELAISLSQNGNNNVKLYERQCGRFKSYGVNALDNFNSALPTTGVDFSKSSNYLFTYNNGTCRVYEQLDTGWIGPAPLADTGLSCPAYNAAPQTAAAMSENGYLVITQSAAPYAKMWKHDNGKFLAFNDTSPAIVFSPALAAMPNRVAISRNGNYIAFTRTAATTYTYIYARTGDRLYTRMTDPASKPTPAGAMVFSPDEKMMAMALNASTTVRIWTINQVTNAFSLLTTLNHGTSNRTILSYSPSGDLFVTVGGSPVSAASMANDIRLYRVTGTTYTALAAPLPGSYTYTGGSFLDAAFTKDSTFLVMPYTTTGGGYLRAMVLRRATPVRFKEVPGVLGSNQPHISDTLNASENPLRVRVAY